MSVGKVWSGDKLGLGEDFEENTVLSEGKCDRRTPLLAEASRTGVLMKVWPRASPASGRKFRDITGSRVGAGPFCGALGSIWRLRGMWSWNWRPRPAARSGLPRSHGSMTVVRRTWRELPTMQRRRRSKVPIWRRPCLLLETDVPGNRKLNRSGRRNWQKSPSRRKIWS